ncbi:major facilitator superfamily domain-containing protein [Naematelia encephala]|uniref:Major facilitator superfamily domain-containing protein n=1 Tax=Naematelia encephala TaxID=71784 RepID=A0A1Y2B4V5_9TREE|nr:major facilitator superfamily domain-containing protein [Naematelia encephala]
MAGPVLGSMLGYWILFGGWRWLFWTITILSALNLCLFTALTEETYAPAIEKVLKYRAQHPIPEPRSFTEKISPRRISHELGWMTAMVSADEAKSVFSKAFSRPGRLLFTNPVAFVFSAYYAYVYAIIYIFLVSVPLLFGSPPFLKPGLFSYQWTQATLSLAYVGLAVGFAISATTAAFAQDKIYKYLSKRNGDSGRPEYRLVLTQTGMCVMPIGLLIFGWTAHAETHWIGPEIGMVLLALGLMLAFNSIQNFIVDAFFPYSAAAVAAATALRSVLACILPEFSPDLFHNLGWGWGGTLLALVAFAAVPAPAIMFVYGQRFRERFKFEG